MSAKAHAQTVKSVRSVKTTDVCEWSNGGICCCMMCLCEGSD